MSFALRFKVAARCALACALAACSAETEPLTQIVVVVDSDFSGLTRFEAEVEGFEDPHTVRADLEDEPLPRRFSLVHDAGPLGPIAVTVRAYTEGDDPILVEPRTGMFFKAGQTLQLKIDLLAACVGLCDEGQACIAPGECVSSDEAAVLTPWTGPPDGLSVGGPLDGMDGSVSMMPDGSTEEGGVEIDAGRDANIEDADAVDRDAEQDASEDAHIDAGADAHVPEPIWPYVPANIDVGDGALTGLARTDVALDCDGTALIDSSDPPSATGFCDQAPAFAVVDQLSGGGEVLAVVMSSLSIGATSSLKLVGSRPIVLLVGGDADIAGAIDASADGSVPGPGGSDDAVCGASNGVSGSAGVVSGSTNVGSGGGSGGGFGRAGSGGGASGLGSTVPAVAGGEAAAPEPTLSPLRGGCRGGAGGIKVTGMSAAAGGGGGAVQLSVAGQLTLSGVIHAGGGGGAPGAGGLAGGGGGGSGGAILIEAASFAIDPSAVVTANGGGGGGGQPQSTLTSAPGEDGAASTSRALGGAGTTTGGDGGLGSALQGAPTPGEGASSGGSCGFAPSNCHYGGGGGGAGGVGRIRIRGASSCALPGTFSPAPSVACESCGRACPEQPDVTCVARASGAAVYSACEIELAQADARALCQSTGQDLVKIEDATENTFLSSIIDGDVWLGASDLVEDDWRWLAGDTAFWSGDEDGSAVGGAFAAWSVDNEPNGSGDCARLRPDGTWADLDCSDELPFLCEPP